MNIAIIGGGASGVLCAIKLKKAKPELDITLFEQNSRLLKKLLKTGNGKCNIMNSNITKEFYNDFSLFSNEFDIKQEFLDMGLVLKELTLGRIYPYSEQASTVVNLLINELERLNVTIKVNYLVSDIKNSNNKFIINDSLRFDKVILSTGSISQEKTNGYDILKDLGLSVTPLRPGLVPIVTYEKTSHLSGLRVKAQTIIKDKKLEGELLFKDDGLSGILSLDISRLVDINDVISFDLMSEYNSNELKNIIKTKEALYGIFPKMLASDIIERASGDIIKIVEIIKSYKFKVKSFKGFNESQITIGGLSLKEIDNNLMVKKIPNLYVTGEVLDIDGASGGYNLYFAWMSALIVSKAIIE